jgi:hypothetical protein
LGGFRPAFERDRWGGALLTDLAQPRDEALVLGARSVGDAKVAAVTEALARAHGHAAAAELAYDLGLVAVAEVEPEEVGLALGGREPEVLELLGHP